MTDTTTHLTIALFDYGGVIAEEGFRGGLYAIAEKNGLDPAPFHQDVARLIADCGYLTGRTDEAVFWASLRSKYALAQTDQQLRREILKRFVLRPGLLDTVFRLRTSGIPVGMISDQTNWLDELNERDGFFACFDHVFNSYHLHASKYQGDLFAAVAGQLQTAPPEILIVDDNAANIEKARQQGFVAIHFTAEQNLLQELRAVFPDAALPG